MEAIVDCKENAVFEEGPDLLSIGSVDDKKLSRSTRKKYFFGSIASDMEE